MTTKLTKKDMFITLADLVGAAREVEDLKTFDFNALNDFINKQIDDLDKKTDAARKRAAKKKNEGDDLRETLFGLLTPTPQTIPELLPKIQGAMDDEGITAQKLAARLKQLVDLNRVEKSEVSVASGEGERKRKLIAYAVKVVEDVTVDED